MAQEELCLDGEEWRDVVGFENYYQVSDKGRIRSVDRMVKSAMCKSGEYFVKGKMLKPFTSCGGHPRVILCKDKRHVRAFVWKIVADAFLDFDKDKEVVFHKDLDTTNNAANNIVPCTIDEYRALMSSHRPFDDLPGEEWREAVGFNGDYLVSNMGRIYSVQRIIKTGKARMTATGGTLISPITVDGYAVAELRLSNRTKKKCVHRLVADAFIPNGDNKPEVDHIDANRDNNCVSNLRWVTSEENNQHRDELGHCANNAHHMHKKEVAERLSSGRKSPLIRSDGKRYASITEAASDIGRSRVSLVRHLSGKTKTCGGFTFQYA